MSSLPLLVFDEIAFDEAAAIYFPPLEAVMTVSGESNDGPLFVIVVRPPSSLRGARRIFNGIAEPAICVTKLRAAGFMKTVKQGVVSALICPLGQLCENLVQTLSQKICLCRFCKSELLYPRPPGRRV